MKSLNRREFVKGSLGTLATLTVLPKSGSFAANEKVIIGVMAVSYTHLTLPTTPYV